MNKFAFHTAALTFAVLPWFCAPVLAQPFAVQRIEITSVRHDVRTLCPKIEDDLRTQLARRLDALPEQALVEVTFHLDGRTIDGVQTRGSTFDARRAVRQAVHYIGCDNAGAGRQRVHFEVSYRWDDSADAGQPMAHRAEALRAAVNRR